MSAENPVCHGQHCDRSTPPRHVGGVECACPSLTCSRHGDCDACRARHRTTLPHCERPVEG